MTWDTSKFVSLDLETHLIEPGILAPKIVCGSVAYPTDGGLLLEQGWVVGYAMRLLQTDRVIVGANVAFDFGCLATADPDLLPLIFAAYAAGRVYDVQVAQALHAIAEGNLFLDPVTGDPVRGRYSLDRCVQYVLGRDDSKVRDDWRLRYAMLDGVPIDQWPEEAQRYPIDDAVNTLEVAVAQVDGGGAGPTPGPHRNLDDLSRQVEAAWAMHLGAMWGMRVDQGRVAALRAEVEIKHADFVQRFAKLGLFKPDGKEDGRAVKRAVVHAYGGGAACTACVDGKILSPKSGNPINCAACSGTGLTPAGAPRTPTGGICADRDALIESGDSDLIAFGESEAEKIRDTYLPKLESEELGRSLRPNVLVASGRTSYDGLIQLLPKSGGVRECFKARLGYVYCSVDYAALELCTLAQVCLWTVKQSQMAETINATGDPGGLHTAFAATMRGWTTEQMAGALKSKDPTQREEAKKWRSAAKAGNFGLPGGMGAAKLVLSKRKKSEGETVGPDGTHYPGIRFCVLIGGAERCGIQKVTEWKNKPTPPLCKACVEIVERDLRPAWFRQWPEVPKYFGWVQARLEIAPDLPCLPSGRIRGGLDFTNGTNNGFQSLAADGAKAALRALTRECYLDRASPLWGTRPIIFVHDEVIAEMPAEAAHLAGPRMAEIMVSVMREWVPDVTIKAEPALMRFWDKAAEPVYKDGRLIPWEDRDV